MKEYVKPDLVYENFSLTNNVASSCSLNLNHGEADQACAYDIGDNITVFSKDSCSITYDAYVEVYGYQGNEITFFTS